MVAPISVALKTSEGVFYFFLEPCTARQDAAPNPALANNIFFCM